MNIESPRPHFNAYYHDNRLLIQFIVSDFLAAYGHSQHLKVLSDQITANSFPEVLLSQIKNTITTLLGTDHHNSRPWGPHWKMGSLTKLKKHCEQLSSNTLHQNKVHRQMQKHAYRAWLCCLQCQEMTGEVQPQASPYTVPLKTSLPTTLARALVSLNTRFMSLSKVLLRALEPFSQDEVIILFLKRHQEQLASIFDSATLTSFVRSSSKKMGVLTSCTQ